MKTLAEMILFQEKKLEKFDETTKQTAGYMRRICIFTAAN